MRILAAGFLYSATVNLGEGISTRSKETLVIVLGTDSGGHIQQKQDRAIVLVGGVCTLSQLVTPRIIRSKRIVW